MSQTFNFGIYGPKRSNHDVVLMKALTTIAALVLYHVLFSYVRVCILLETSPIYSLFLANSLTNTQKMALSSTYAGGIATFQICKGVFLTVRIQYGRGSRLKSEFTKLWAFAR